MRAGVDEVEVLALAEIAEGGGEKNQRKAATIAEDKHLEVAAQMGRKPAEITFVHARGRIKASPRRFGDQKFSGIRVRPTGVCADDSPRR